MGPAGWWLVVCGGLAAATGEAPGRPISLGEAVAEAALCSPRARVAHARRAEGRAATVGAGAWAASNPALGLQAGPGFVDPGRRPDLEFMVQLSWPVDLGRSFGRRAQWAEARDAEAAAGLVAELRQLAADVGQAYLDAVAADVRRQLAAARAELARALEHVACVRRAAGTGGDGDVALATLARAQDEAAQALAAGRERAAGQVLAGLLGWSPGVRPAVSPPAEVDLPWPSGVLPAPEPGRVRPDAERADVRLARAVHATGDAEHAWQRAAGWPQPVVGLGGGRGPEFQISLGATVPLPLYQRNQTAAAQAAARATTARHDRLRAERAAAADVEAAAASHAAAVAAQALLASAAPAIDVADHLAVRAYELGESNLAAALWARREANAARLALGEAEIGRLRARLALVLAAGSLPGSVPAAAGARTAACGAAAGGEDGT